MSPQEKAIRQRLKDDLEHYAAKCLKIRKKSGAIEPFIFNRAQRYIHERLERQRAETGRVRAMILKGRQQGVSTYVGARFYHKVTHSRGLRVFILTHEDQATQNLFDMVSAYHDNCPALVRPETGHANAKELMFAGLNSGYKVGTAGTKGAGRSSTIQLFHGSECGFWPHGESHSAGIMQAVPDEAGTEIILESTANGLGTFFHKMWRDAERGEGDYIAIFVPWFWQDEYVRTVPPDFMMSDDERGQADIYGLTPGQIAWRRNKAIELKDDLLVMQEFPNCAHDAFVTTGHDSFIKSASVICARNAECEGLGPLIFGVDPARFGDDRFVVARRRGRKLIDFEARSKLDNVAGANWVKQLIDRDKPDAVFVDVGGQGAGVVDILLSWGGVYASVVRPIDFGGAPQEPEVYLDNGETRPGPRNRRTEMWSRSRDWLDAVGGADLPDDDALQSDACAPGYSYGMDQRLLLEPKEKMRARGVSSPDIWDAVALTFAEPVVERSPARPRQRTGGGQFSWMG